jgi:hypothetical protein
MIKHVQAELRFLRQLNEMNDPLFPAAVCWSGIKILLLLQLANWYLFAVAH